MVGFHEALFAKFNLTSQQYNVLRILRGQHPKPATVSLIRERMIDKMSDTSRLVERLRKAGFVDRVANKIDKRAVDVIITEQGMNTLAEIDAIDQELFKPTRHLSMDEATQLCVLLEKVMNGLLE